MFGFDGASYGGKERSYVFWASQGEWRKLILIFLLLEKEKFCTCMVMLMTLFPICLFFFFFWWSLDLVIAHIDVHKNENILLPVYEQNWINLVTERKRCNPKCKSMDLNRHVQYRTFLRYFKKNIELLSVDSVMVENEKGLGRLLCFCLYYRFAAC